jgi:hypothetical protein
VQGLFRPDGGPGPTRRAPRRSEFLGQLGRNGLLLHADNSDVSYKAILIRVTGAATYGLALERLGAAPIREARAALVATALLRDLQELVLARLALRLPDVSAAAALSLVRSASAKAWRTLRFVAPLVGPGEKEAS